MRNFFNFNKILIPTIIPLVFRFGLYFILISGIYRIVVNYRFFLGQFGYELPIYLFLWFILAPILLRIVCEVLIILARMNDSLTDIKDRLNTQQEKEST